MQDMSDLAHDAPVRKYYFKRIGDDKIHWNPGHFKCVHISEIVKKKTEV